MPISWGRLRGQLIGLYGSPVECLGFLCPDGFSSSSGLEASQLSVPPLLCLHELADAIHPAPQGQNPESDTSRGLPGGMSSPKKIAADGTL